MSSSTSALGGQHDHHEEVSHSDVCRRDAAWDVRVCGISSPDQTWRGSGRSDDHQRITTEGRISSIDRQRDGYRVRLDRGSYWFRVPHRALRNRRGDFRVGIFVRLGGIFRRGIVHVDVVDWPGYNYGNYYYRDGYVRGVVELVDLRHGTLLLRDHSSGRLVTVDMTRARRRSVDLEDLRRGDYVEISGDWGRGVFEARRVETVRSRRF